MTLLEALAKRRTDIQGQLADESELRELEAILADHGYDELLQAYREFPLSGVEMAFVSPTPRSVTAPGPNFFEENHPDTEHEMFWYPPKSIVRAAKESYAGPAIHLAGYIPFADPTSGADPYYIRIPVDDEAPTQVYCVYDDHVTPDGADPVPPEACRLIAESLAEVVSVARFGSGYDPP